MEPRERISKSKDMHMKMIAGIFDVVSVIAGFFGFNTVTGIIGDGFFFLWYMLLGSPMFKGKSKRLAIANVIAENLPWIGAVYPGFVVLVWKKNAQVAREDAEYNAQQEAKLKQRRLEQQEAATQQTRQQFEIMQGGLKQEENKRYNTGTKSDDNDLQKAV